MLLYFLLNLHYYKINIRINMALELLKIGDKAPDFSVKDHNGNLCSLSDFKNKSIIMWFFPKANTPG